MDGVELPRLRGAVQESYQKGRERRTKLEKSVTGAVSQSHIRNTNTGMKKDP